MCGIVGIVDAKRADLASDIARMQQTLVHRGPDGGGNAAFEGHAAIGMRRLAIVDLAGGIQPMTDEAGRFHVVFNGEIYDHVSLRSELEALGHRFVTDHSDTEVIVHGFEQWGDALFPRLNGMFAIAIWDRDRHELVVARDRAGEKPLYVGRTSGGHAIASELKALFALSDVERRVDATALEQYLAFGYVMGPRTMVQGIEKLPAGHVGRIDASGYRHTPYWSQRFVRTTMSEPEIIAAFDAHLDDAVRRRMVADVPIGLFLSGGLDSSAVAVYMRRHAKDVRAFTVGFEEAPFDEVDYARTVARHLGLKHEVEVLTGAAALNLVPRMPELLDEPMADPSILPTYLVSSATRRHVTVALGGDGSDELLMGYRTYQALKVAARFDVLPRHLRGGIARTASLLPDRTLGWVGRGRRFAQGLAVAPEDRQLTRLGPFSGSARWVIGPALLPYLPSDPIAEPRGAISAASSGARGWANRSIAAYFRGYLQEDILVKVDRASMATSLEVRAPFLDPKLIDFLGTVPPNLKLRGLTRKWLLRRAMQGHLPEEIIGRPKQGFGVPLDAWFRGPLRGLTQDVLNPSTLEGSGWLDPAAIARLLAAQSGGRVDHGNRLWVLLQLELWRRHWDIGGPA